MTLPLKLDFGNISHADEYESRKEDYIQNLFCFDHPEDFVYEKECFELLNSLKNEKRKIRIWANNRCCEELCFLYFLMSFLKEKDIYCVDIPIDQNKEDRRFDTYTYTSNLKNLDCISYYRVDNKTKYEYEQKWNELKNINSNLRILKDNKIYSINYDDAVDIVLDVLNKEENVMQLIGQLQDNNPLHLNYHQLLALMNYMIKSHLVYVLMKKIKNRMYGEYYLYIRNNVS